MQTVIKQIKKKKISQETFMWLLRQAKRAQLSCTAAELQLSDRLKEKTVAVKMEGALTFAHIASLHLSRNASNTAN